MSPAVDAPATVKPCPTCGGPAREDYGDYGRGVALMLVCRRQAEHDRVAELDEQRGRLAQEIVWMQATSGRHPAALDRLEAELDAVIDEQYLLSQRQMGWVA